MVPTSYNFHISPVVLRYGTERHANLPAGAVVTVICTECCSDDPSRVTFTV